jgi:hypothetical protein
MESTSKSSSIRDIENKYGINLTTCSRSELDLLTSKYSNKKVITKLSDLMINAHRFDLDNMSTVEKANLKYLVMSTEELLSIFNKIAKRVYYKPREYRLRWLMSLNDFCQICAYKLLLNDGILRFNADYQLEPAIYCWLLRTAMWQSYKKVSRADELTILDEPCGEDNNTTLGEIMLKDNSYEVKACSYESDSRIKEILSNMDKTPSNKIIFKAGETKIPFSEYTLAKLFISHQLGKHELSKIMYNTTNNKIVSNQIFNKFYKRTLIHISKLLNNEAKHIGETFSIKESDL